MKLNKMTSLDSDDDTGKSVGQFTKIFESQLDQFELVTNNKIKELKLQLDELIKQKQKFKLIQICHIPENEYIQDLTIDLQLEYEEAGKNEYAPFIDGNLIISYNFINKNEKVKVVLTVDISCDKTYDCREIVNNECYVDLQVISNISQKIADLEQQITDIKEKIKKDLQFKSFWQPSKAEKEEDKKIEDQANKEIENIKIKIEELKKKEVDYEYDEQEYIVINNKQKMSIYLDVAGELVPSEENWENAINCVLKYVEDNGWLCLMQQIAECKKI